MDDTIGLGGVRTNMALQILDCVIASPNNSGVMNHIELKISQNQIDVYATDAGVAPSPATLRKIAVVTNANLSFSRGLIWLEDVHYNADKGGAPSQRQHTFVWDNIAFDGPFTYRDFSYDALDVNQPDGTSNAVSLGKVSFPNQTTSWNVLNLPANRQAEVVRVLFNFFEYTPVATVLNVTVNGHAHSVPWPYPDSQGFTWKTFAVTVPITDLVTGTNVVQLGSDQSMVTSNVNIVLVNVPGGMPILPGSNNVYPIGATTPPPQPVNGACGSANGTTLASAPSTNLCLAGTSSPVMGTGPWTWSCNGSNGGSNANCLAQKTVVPPTVVNGVCGSANGVAVTSVPTSNLCSTGSVIGPWKWSGGSLNGVADGPWSWSCTGSSNGGITVNCSASHK